MTEDASPSTAQDWETLGAALDQTEGFIRRFCALPEAAYLPVTLWVIATYVATVFECFPYLALLSPEKRCGKTRLLEVLELLSYNAWRGAGATPAALYRLVQTTGTLLLDEQEFLNTPAKSESQQLMIGVLNAGYRKGATVPRYDYKAKKVECLPVYGPKAFAAIGRLPDTISDRSINLMMQRKTKSQQVKRLLIRRARAEAEAIRAVIHGVMHKHLEEVTTAYDNLIDYDLDYLNDRDADTWMSLFALCSVLDPSRSSELKRCSIVLTSAKQDNDVDASQSLRLLRDLRQVWPDGKEDVQTSVLLTLLSGLPGAEWDSATFNARKLASLLRPFGCLPDQYREGEKGGLRGYCRTALAGAWDKYL